MAGVNADDMVASISPATRRMPLIFGEFSNANCPERRRRERRRRNGFTPSGGGPANLAKIAQPLMAGLPRRVGEKSREGRQNGSSVPGGTGEIYRALHPALKGWAIFKGYFNRQTPRSGWMRKPRSQMWRLTGDPTFDQMSGSSMPRETINLDLLTGDPQGLRIATFNQTWTGKGFAAPRTLLKELLDRPEMDSPGVYILTAREAEINEPPALAYIGVGKSISNRLKNRKEEFWSQAFIFIGMAGSLHEGHIKYLEGKLIDEAKKIGQFKITNEQGSGGPLPDHETAGMDLFLEKMRILLPVFGCKLLVPKAQASKNKSLVNKIKGLVAHGNRSAGGFVVFKDSEAVLEPRKYAAEKKNWTYLQREKLIQSKVLVAESDRLRFSKDYEFASPSAAAAIIRGGNANGLTSWKNAEGKTLKEIDAAI